MASDRGAKPYLERLKRLKKTQGIFLERKIRNRIWGRKIEEMKGEPESDLVALRYHFLIDFQIPTLP